MCMEVHEGCVQHRRPARCWLPAGVWLVRSGCVQTAGGAVSAVMAECVNRPMHAQAPFVKCIVRTV